ncbi:MAG: hypothetical protein D6715_06690, partial [Calditrichaeota bacterium]
MKLFCLKDRTKFLLAIGVAGCCLLSFCLFTNEVAVFRKYLDSDIPFVYLLHQSVPPNWIPSIDAGAQAWEDVVSSYWEFENGGLTAADSAARDSINLVFFDFQGVNFAPGTNVIAFSRTFTEGSGINFHAVESDLIWNARDFPPSPTGASGQQDLQSVIAHEFGHHLGMAHQGPVGGPPGCGELIIAATMYGQSAAGDTTKRSLHIHDKAGVSVLYPVWKLNGSITDAGTGQPLLNAGLQADTVFGAILGQVEQIPGQNRWEIPGFVVKRFTLDSTADFDVTVLVPQFTLTASRFGYQDQSVQVQFGPPGGIGQTEIQTVNFALSPSPQAPLNLTLRDSLSSAAVSGRLQIFATTDKPGVPSQALVDTLVDSTGQLSVNLPAGEDYLLALDPVVPYPARTIAVKNHSPGGTNLAVNFAPARVLLVNDDLDESFESFFTESLQTLNVSYHLWRIFEDGPVDTSVFELFPEPRLVIWYTGNASQNVLSDAEQIQLAAYLDGGGRLFLSGQNIVEASPTGALLSRLGIAFEKNVLPPRIKGVPGDVIGNGLVLSSVGGANNQNSKDALVVDSSRATVIFTYGNTPIGNAGIRAAGPADTWRVVALGFGFEGINNQNGERDLVLSRVLAWLSGVVTGIEAPSVSHAQQPDAIRLKPMYPNPFNPTTLVEFEL